MVVPNSVAATIYTMCTKILQAMRYLPVVILLCSLLSCETKKHFTIHGHITGLPDSTQLMLQNMSTGLLIDSAVVLNNEFRFKGHLNEVPEELRIITGRKEWLRGNLYYTDLLLGNENAYLQGDISDLPFNVNVTGSAILKEAEAYHKLQHKWKTKIDSAKNRIKTLDESSAEKRNAEESLEDLRFKYDQSIRNYLKNNFNTYNALLVYSYRRDFPTNILDSLYNTLSPELKACKYGRAIKTEIDFPKLKVGDTYYDFQTTDVHGNKVSPSEIKGKYILLQFAGSSCGPSDESIEHMKQVYNQYADSIVFFSAFVEPPNSFLPYVTTKQIPWTSTWISQARLGDASIMYNITGTPTFYLISPEKKIVTSWFGYEDGIIEKHIGSIIKN